MAMIRLGWEMIRRNGLTIFIRNATAYVYANYLSAAVMPLIVRRFRSAKKGANSIDDAVRLAFSFRFLGHSIQPVQIEGEISRLMEILVGLKPRRIIDIGTCFGGTMYLFLKTSAPDAVIISMDLRNQNYRLPLYNEFTEGGQEIRLLRSDSHADATLRGVKEILGGEKADLLFIDGDHSYDGAKRDFEMYSGLVGKGGVVAFHDIAVDPVILPGYGVSRLWNEVKGNYRFEEIVRSTEKDTMGIGVLYL